MMTKSQAKLGLALVTSKLNKFPSKTSTTKINCDKLFGMERSFIELTISTEGEEKEN